MGNIKSLWDSWLPISTMDRHHLLRLTVLISAVLCAQLALAARKLPADRARGSPAAEAATLLASRFAYANPMLLTFQGAVLDGISQHPEPVVLHALVKAKVLRTGSYIVRAVLNTQRTALQSMIDKINRLSCACARSAFTVCYLQATKILHPHLKTLQCAWSIKKAALPMSQQGGLRCHLRCWVCGTLR